MNLNNEPKNFSEDSGTTSPPQDHLLIENLNGMFNYTFQEGSSIKFKISSHMALYQLLMGGFFGEPSYYLSCTSQKKNNSYENRLKTLYDEYFYTQDGEKSTVIDVFNRVTSIALQEDFERTVKIAIEVRKSGMRKGPAALIVKAILHPNRNIFTKSKPGILQKYIMDLLILPTDAWELISFYIDNKGSIKGFPNILKKAIADYLHKCKPYHLKKYLRIAHIIDMIRITHPKPNIYLTQLITTGDLINSNLEKTWEVLRSARHSWFYIIHHIHMPHLALLRNLRGIIRENNKDIHFIKMIMDILINGVEKNKQYPFRYLTTFEELKKVITNNTIDQSNILPIKKITRRHKKKLRSSKDKRVYIPTPIPKIVVSTDIESIIFDGLQECIHIAIKNYPILDGDTLCLSDNSSSTRNSFQSAYGKQNISSIANLSSIITAINCTGRSTVGLFGNGLELCSIEKNVNILEKVVELEEISKRITGRTENGIWIFFRDAFKAAKKGDASRYKYENIFIYSDMQCGHGEMYGLNPYEFAEYVWKEEKNSKLSTNKYIDVLRLIRTYRRVINPRVNVFMIQIAPHTDSLIPETLYRAHILSGWNGNEVVYASHMNRLMDYIDNMRNGLQSKTII